MLWPKAWRRSDWGESFENAGPKCLEAEGLVVAGGWIREGAGENRVTRYLAADTQAIRPSPRELPEFVGGLNARPSAVKGEGLFRSLVKKRSFVNTRLDINQLVTVCRGCEGVFDASRMPNMVRIGLSSRGAGAAIMPKKPKSRGKAEGRSHSKSPRGARAAFLSRVPNGSLMAGVFILALAVRLIYLGQLSDAPFYHNPVGDSKIYHERAVEIAGGDVVGRDAYFHSSPFYPYFLSLVYRVFGEHLSLVRIIQILIGSANCVLIYWLAKGLDRRRRGPPLLAGLFAALYGTLVFFDGDLLMITLVLFFSSASLALLVAADDRLSRPRVVGDRQSPGVSKGPSESEESRGSGEVGSSGAGIGRVLNSPRSELEGGTRIPIWLVFFLAGVSLGFAGLGKPNVLVFAPFGFVWILTGFDKRIESGRWRAAVLFAVGVLVAVFPITARNYAVSRDLVLVSSNAGVNLFIGNNDKATGIFFLPPSSGLENSHLYLSSRDVAGKAMGRTDLKPSEVSRYWTGRAMDYVREQPGDAARLLARKFLLFWNQYEIPNHHNRYFVGINYAPLLERLFVGFWLIVPLSIVGFMFFVGAGQSRRVYRLYVVFIIVYMVSLVPFFVTARYRLPVVPLLTVFAALGVFGLVDFVRRRYFKRLVIAVVSAAVGAVVVWLPIVDYDFGFSHTVVGTAYSDLATKHPDRGPEYITKAIIHYKKAIELRPLFVDAHYNLGVAYQRIGYFSGAVSELGTAAALKPNHRYAAKALAESRVSLGETGDKIDVRAIPKTPFEKGLELTQAGMRSAAVDQYRIVLREDPHHPGAYSQLGAIEFDQGNYAGAISLFEKGLKFQPDHFVLNNNIAGAYYRKGDVDKARRHWQRCLEIQPGNEGVQRQLQMLDG